MGALRRNFVQQALAAALGALLVGSLAGCGAPRAMVATSKSPAGAAPTKAIGNGTPAVTFKLVDSEVDSWVIGSIDRRVRGGQTRGHERTVVPFEVADLPTANVPSALDDKDAPLTISGGAPAEIQIKKNASYGYDMSGGTTYNTVSVVNHFASGLISVAGQEASFVNGPTGSVGGVSIQCAPWSRVVSAHWEGIVAKAPGSAVTAYEMVDGWFDMKACKLVEARRTRVNLAEIVPGTLYGYRQCEENDCVARQSVVLVAPNATNALSQSGPLRSQRGAQLPKFVLPVRRGGSESLLMGIPPATNSTMARSLSVEIAQGTADEAPIATAFVADVMN